MRVDRLSYLLVAVVSLLLGTSGWASYYSQPTAEVYLIDSIQVDAPQVTLGEVASIETEDKALRARLVEFPIAEAPRLGTKRVLSAYKIKAALAKEGIDSVKVNGLQTTVRTRERILSREELQQAIVQWAEESSSKETEVSLQFLKLPMSWKIPAGEELELSVSSGSSPRSKVKNLTLRASYQGHTYGTIHARVEVTQFATVPVIVRPLSKGEALTTSHVEERRADISKANGSEAVSVKEMIGMVAKRPLSVGSLLSKQYFEQPVLIERGSLNRIAVMNDGVMMMVTGAKALQQGRHGDVVLFSNPMNKNKPLSAKVVKTGLAYIELQ